jgi:hypothetical protein
MPGCQNFVKGFMQAWLTLVYNLCMAIQPVAAKCISSGDECAKLAEAGVFRGRVHSVFDRVINIETDKTHAIDSLFSICSRDVAPAPGRIVTGGQVSWLSLGLLADQEISIEYGDAPLWHCKKDYELSASGDILKRLSKIQIPISGELAGLDYNDADALIGRGLGLTPSGDDFLAGVLFSLHFLNCSRLLDPLAQKVSGLLHKTTRLSRHFLAYALAGKWGQTEEKIMLALMADAGEDLGRALSCQLAVGATSGADELAGMAAGIYAALEGKN